MKDPKQKKCYYFVDESGDPNFFNKHGKNLLLSGDSSPIFIGGYLETDDMNSIHKLMNEVREEIINDEYLSDIPSIKKSIKHFHAKDDCPEVREKVFKAINKMDIKVHVIVARKNSDQFRSKFNTKSKKICMNS